MWRDKPDLLWSYWEKQYPGEVSFMMTNVDTHNEHQDIGPSNQTDIK